MVKRKSNERFKLTNYPLKKIGLAAVAVLICGGLIYFTFFHETSQSGNGTQMTTSDGKKVDLSPANNSDKQSNDANKQAIVSHDEKLNSSSQTPSTSSSVVITDVTATSAKAYVQGVFEDSGSCTATASQNSQIISASSQGFENVSYTQCAPMDWQAHLGPGTWAITVTYKSATTNITANKTVQL